jgi:hypothetical protein
MEKQKTIYDLKLHETMSIENCTDIIRVEGGWIYRGYETVNGDISTQCFVPFGNQLQEDREE